jgi:hypothetical protein
MVAVTVLVQVVTMAAIASMAEVITSTSTGSAVTTIARMVADQVPACTQEQPVRLETR